MAKELLAGIVNEQQMEIYAEETAKIQKKITELRALLKDKHTISKEDAEFFRKLSAKYLDLQGEYDQLKEKYDSLYEDYIALKRDRDDDCRDCRVGE